MTRPGTAATDSAPEPEPQRPKLLASWYTEGLSDGIGDRLMMFDNSGTPSLELLRFRPHLAGAGGFEDALRSRVRQLHDFTHPAFSQVRAVEHLEGDGGLALVSTFTPGKRLSEIFRSPRTKAGVHPAFAAWLIRDLTSALADLQRHRDGISHGALTPDRIVLTAEGRLVITEHVLGAALATLRLPSARLWQELALVAPETPAGVSILDARTDIIQLGWVVLSILLGRRISPSEYPRHIEELFDEFAETGGRRSPGLVPALLRWLERALRVDGRMFESAVEARHALSDLAVHGGPHAIEHMAPRQAPPPLPEHHAASAATFAAATQARDRADRPVFRSREDRSDAPARRSFKWGWTVAALLGVCAAAEGVAIGRLVSIRPRAAPPSPIPLVVDSAEPGEAVIVDGREVGVTPLQLKVGTDIRSVRVRSRVPAPVSDRPVAQAAPLADRPADSTAAQLVARERRGGIRLVSPIELQVLEGERVLGSSADGPIVTTVGRHELDFINTAFGFRVRQAVDIRPGQIAPLRITPPEGRVSVNASPWAHVSIDGNSLGETPLANVPLAVGEHQITFRHPQLGEQTQKFIVKPASLTRVSATFARQ